jgi:hypothetical protein
MSLAERLSQAKPKKSGLPCGVTRIMSEMQSDDQLALEEILYQEPRIVSNVQLQQILVDEGYDISYSSIAQHRRKQCRCFTGRDTRISAGANV